MNLKNNIRYLLCVHDMTNADLAAKLNISPQAVSKWLKPNSDAQPSLENLLLISDIFSVSLDALLKEDLQAGSVDKETGFPEKIESVIMQLERMRAELKKKDRIAPPPPAWVQPDPL